MRTSVAAVVLFSLLSISADAWSGNTNFNVSAPNAPASYTINGVSDPPLTLARGTTYTFLLDVSGHPFSIKTAQVSGSGSRYNDGVTGNGNMSGSLIFAVPLNAPNTLFYNCEIHLAMGGTLTIVDPPPIFINGFEDP